MTARARDVDALIAIGAICIVRWGADPDAELVRNVTARLLDTRRIQQRPLSLVVIAHPAMKEPSQEAREEFMRKGPSFARALSCAYAVVSPDALHRRVQIGVFEAMKAFNPVPSDICDSLDVALRSAAIAVGAKPESVIEEARRQGLYDDDDDEPASVRRPANPARTGERP